jgi:SAM-dependent MidA family methyltransferase
LVESSAILRNHQKHTLGKRASYHPEIDQALEACEGNAVIFSNELVDAFPVRWFQQSTDGWMEIALDHSEQPPREILIPPTSLPESSIFQRDFPPSQRVEVHASYHQWLKSWLPLWRRGEMLTIDYGNTAEALYHRQPAGSLRGYFLQQRLEGLAIYQHPGLQDLTADVNFTDLIEWAKPWLHHQKPENFADFIRPFCNDQDARILAASEYFMALRQSPKRLS